MTSEPKPKVVILVASFNGEHYLTEQLQSFKNQTFQPQEVLLSDDGSHDDTIKIFTTFMTAWPECKFRILKGPKKGFAENFAHLIKNCPECDIAFFSDQDDVWFHEKIERGIAALAGKPGPALYGSRTEICDNRLTPLTLSKLMPYTGTLGHALTQSIAGGNTMAMNLALLEKVKATLANTSIPSTHDWWLYQFTMATGGQTFFDKQPTLYYRQHRNNLWGQTGTASARIKRIRAVKSGTYRIWINANLKSLQDLGENLSPEASVYLEKVRLARQKRGFFRALSLSKLGLHRHGINGRINFFVLSALGLT